jgi:hypothetical protein
MPIGRLNHINASGILLASAVEHHLASVPMALFTETINSDAYKENLI